MWSLLSIRRKVSLTLVGAGILYASYQFFSVGVTGDLGVWATITLFTTPAPVLVSVAYLLGKHVKLWRLTRWYLWPKVFPDLNGDWVGELESSYTGTGAPDKLEITIKQTWATINVDNNNGTGNGVSTSKSLSVKPGWENDQPLLLVLARGVSLRLSSTDASEFDIAARYVYESSNDTLRCCYWTNRAYMQNSQTAGMIVLQRKRAIGTK